MKGIILAGGSGTRLYPLTLAVSKQLAADLQQADDLLPAVDAHAGRHPRDPVITTPQDQDGFKRLLGDGSELGLRFEYTAQPSPDGLAQAFILGRDFVGDDRVALALGDNIFFGHGLPEMLRTRGGAAERRDGLRLPGARSRAVRRRRVRRRRPGRQPRGEAAHAEVAVRGHRALLLRQRRPRHRGRTSKPSPRGELEITDVNRRLPAARQPDRRAARPRLRVARHRHARIAAGGLDCSSRPSRSGRA